MPTSSQGKKRRIRATRTDLYELAREVVSINPWAQPHGKRRAAWSNVLKRLRNKGHWQHGSVETMKNRMNGMINYFEVS